MFRIVSITMLALLLSACTAVSHNKTTELSPEEKIKIAKEKDYLQQQISSKDKELLEVESEKEALETKIKNIRKESEQIDKELDKRLAAAQKLLAEAQELASKLRPPTEEDETAAEKLLLEAEFFQRQNPTEPKSVVASKYKLVCEHYSRTKAAKKAKEILDKLSK